MQTPYIPGPNPAVSGSVGLQYGADLYGLLNTNASGARKQHDRLGGLDAIANAPSGALVAVIREPAAAGLPSYASDDVVLFVNLTSVTLASPELGLTFDKHSTFETPLTVGGLAVNSAVGGSASDVPITGLPAGAVWATLVPSNHGSVYVNATLSGWQVNAISDQSLVAGSVQYITAQSPQPSVGAAIPSLQAVAVSPDGKTLYGVNTQENILVVASASDLTQIQTFQNGNAQAGGTVVSGIGGAIAVAVSPDGRDVYVLGSTDSAIAVFSRSSTGALTFQQSISVSGIGTLTSLVVAAKPAGSNDSVFVGGSGGVEFFQGNTAKNTLTLSAQNTSVKSISSLAVSRDGTLLYAVSSTSSALLVLKTSGLSLVGTYTSTSVTARSVQAPADTLDQANGIAVSGDDHYVYIIGGSSGTLTVLERNLSTNALTWVETLTDGVNGARGLTGADDVVVSNDGKYVDITSRSGNSLAIYAIQSDGTLILDQVVRGSIGLMQPSSLAVDNADDNVYVASQAGIGFGGGGLAAFKPAPSQAPRSLLVSYSNISDARTSISAIAATRSPRPTAATAAALNITTGNGVDSVNLLDIGGTTTVNTGSGPDQVTAHPGTSDTGAKLTINAGGGDDYVELDAAAKGDVITINLGNGNSTAQVEDTGLDPTATVAVNGGQGADTLLFDTQGKAITAYDSSGQTITSGEPAIPDGQIQIASGANAKVVYSQIRAIPGFVGTVVSAGHYPSLREGQGITLAGSARPATGATILSESWDINGDGVFGDATGLSPILTWCSLPAWA